MAKELKSPYNKYGALTLEVHNLLEDGDMDKMIGGVIGMVFEMGYHPGPVAAYIGSMADGYATDLLLRNALEMKQQERKEE